MLYGLETVTLKKRQEAEMEVAELKMLRFSLGVTRMDKIRIRLVDSDEIMALCFNLSEHICYELVEEVAAYVQGVEVVCAQNDAVCI